jgi:DNA-binding transcriptional LysR family regulator
MAARLDLYQLRAFFALAQTLSFTRAAARIHVSQSAVSHAVKKLEAGAGCQLVSRQGRRVGLTAEGMELAHSCRVVFGELERAGDALSSRAKLVQTIRMGTTVEFGTLVLVRHMKPFLARNRDIHIDLRFTNNPLPALMSDELDIVVDCRRHALAGLERTELFREEYAVVAAPLYLRGKVVRVPRDIEDQTIISLDKNASWWGRFVQAVPRGEQPAFKRESVIEIDHIRGIINAAEAGLGIALLPKYAIVTELRRRRLVDLFPDIRVKEDVFSIYQKKRKAGLDANRRLVAYLVQLRPEEFGGVRSGGVGRALTSARGGVDNPAREEDPHVRRSAVPGTR